MFDKQAMLEAHVQFELARWQGASPAQYAGGGGRRAFCLGREHQTQRSGNAGANHRRDPARRDQYARGG
jgi:hypothetical protein